MFHILTEKKNVCTVKPWIPEQQGRIGIHARKHYDVKDRSREQTTLTLYKHKSKPEMEPFYNNKLGVNSCIKLGQGACHFLKEQDIGKEEQV